MNQDETGNEQDTARSVWGETGFSGITLVLGAGGGRLVELLREQVRRADGQLAVLDYHWSRLRAVSGSAGDGAQCLRARYRHLPVLSDSVDLLVINGVLRETPETRYERLFEELWRAAACFLAEHALMWQVWDLAGGLGNPSAWERLADPGVRRAAAAVIMQAREQCSEAADRIEGVLARWV